MKVISRKQTNKDDKTDTEIKRTERKLEISIYALIIIVTIALMLLFFNFFLME
jgi:hypothetical protein